jgi:hypothetical protein
VCKTAHSFHYFPLFPFYSTQPIHVQTACFFADVTRGCSSCFFFFRSLTVVTLLPAEMEGEKERAE